MGANSEAELATRGYTFSELMVAAAAREIADGELVFVGMRLPMLAFLVARRTHAPLTIVLAPANHFFARPRQGLAATGRSRNQPQA